MKRYGLIGATLKHSFSRNYFTEKFKKENIEDSSYENFELASVYDLRKLIHSNPDLQGLNVTIPYKESVISLLDSASDEVKATGACNCILLREGRLQGFNTDIAGFRNSLEPLLRPQHANALVLGSGGASKAVIHALDQLNISHTIVTRHKVFDRLSYEELGKDILQKNKLIINTTPLGMFPDIDHEPAIPYQYLTREHLLFDLVYNPPKTKFLKHGEEKGSQVKNGYEMLVLQAEESWKIWNQPDITF